MRLTSCILAALLLAACSGNTPGKAPSATASAPANVTVGPNVQVSGQNAGLAHGEELIAADPVNARHLIACSSIWLLKARAFPHNGIREVAYVTFDGGATWKQTKLTNVGAFDLDPVCAVGLNGVAYFGGASAYDPSPGHDWLARSTDGGMTWKAPTIFPWGDRDFIAVDASRSAYRGRLYDVSLNAKRASKSGGLASANLGMIVSTDNGVTYRPSTAVYVNPVTHDENAPLDYYSGPVTVLNNGHVVTLAYAWPDSSKPKKMAVFVSTDGGKSFSAPRIVATRAGSPLIGSDDFKEEGASVLPVLASDDTNGPFASRIYVAWQDFTKREYGAGTYPAHQGAIFVASSDDEGKTWSAPAEADDAPPWPQRQYPQVFSPTIAVNGNGVVAVAWFDGRDLPDGTGGTLRMATSNDGGDTFSPSFAVATAPSRLWPDADRLTLEIGSAPGETHFMQDLRYHVFAQDTQGLAADAAGRFHPLWIDNRTGTAQLWTATVAVRARAIEHGDASLSKLRDVSKSVGLEIDGGIYDRRTHDVTADALLWNSSKKAIAGPIRFRVTSLTSVLGVPELQHADNGATGAGAILTFRIENGKTLAPKAQTLPVHLTVHIDNPRSITPDDVNGAAIEFVTIRYSAYAP